MKTLATLVIPCTDTESIAPSFRATTRNPAFKLLPRLFAIFGLVMIFALLGWGACTPGTNRGTWTTSTGNYQILNYNVQSDDVDYYTITVSTTQILKFLVENKDSSQSLTATLYSNGTCGTSIWSVTAGPGESISTTVNAVAGTSYSIRIVGSSASSNTDYNFYGINSSEINVQGNGVTIADGDLTPSSTDNTDFGAVVSGSYRDKTFTIQNIGLADLTIGTFTLPSGFTLQTAPASTVTPGGSTTFTIRFSPITTTSYSGSLSFVTNDSNENPYNFNIKGSGNLASEVCPGSIITNLHGTSVLATQLVSGATIRANETNYYYFVPSVSGTFDVNSTMPGSESNDLTVLDGCGGSAIDESTSDSYNKSLTGIAVRANQAIIVAYKSSSGSDRTYSLGFKFTPSIGGGGGSVTECNNGATPVKNADRDFCLRKQITISGDMVSTGNTLVVAPNSDNSSSSNGSADCSTYSDEAYIDIATNNNADYTMCTYSVNGSTSLAETMAQLVLPDPANSTIKYAALYVQSVISNDQINNVVVKIARNGGTYQTVPKTYVDYDDFEDDTDPDTDNFSMMGDVTSIFTDNNWKDGNYTVSVSNLFEGDTGSTGMYGAWNLVVIYENTNEPTRAISIFDGWTEIWGNEALIPISGFYTPKITPINAKVATFVAEGDYTLNGDLFKALRQSDLQWVDLKNTGQPASATNQSSYSYVKIDGSRTPNPTNNNGIDIQNYSIGTGTTYDLLDTEQTNIDFKFTSTSDRYYPSMIAFATEIYEPKLCYDYTLKQDGRYLTVDRTNNAARVETMVSSSPLEVLVYLRNKEADLSAEGISFTSDLNTTIFNVNQSANIQSSTPNGSGLINRGYINSDPCPAYNKDDSHVTSNSGCTYDTTNYEYIRKDLGDLGSEDYIYAKFTIDPLGISGLVDINESLGLKADYYITVGGNKIVYNRYPLGSSKVPMCTPSTVYKPTWGLFNVVEHGLVQNNIKTQISRKPFDVDVIFDGTPTTGTNDAPSSTVTSTVLVEMIDVDSFGDINASCANPDAGVSTPVFVPISFAPEVAPAYQTLVMPQDITYHNFALKNGAYRVWYFTETNGTLIQNWTATTDPNSKNKIVTEINGLFNSSSHGECNASCGVTGGSAISTDCFTCIKNHYAKPLCSRDNFSVRPEAFDARIKDSNAANTVITDLSHDVYGFAPDTTVNAVLPRMNLAAGYDYGYDINATGYEANASGLVAVPRYTRYFNGANPDYNITMVWDSALTTAECNDVNNRYPSLYMVHGSIQNQSNHQDQVGDYRLNMIDTSWTKVDKTVRVAVLGDGFASGTDCIVGSNTTAGSVAPYGCDISSQHTNINTSIIPNQTLNYKDSNLTFKPAKFDLPFSYGLGRDANGANTGVGGQGFVYMSDLNKTNDMNMSVRATGQIKALGANNMPLSNFVGGCFAKDLNVTAGHDANLTYTTPFVTRMINSTIANVQTYDSLEVAQASSWIGTVDDSNFTKADSGALQSAIRFNFDRNQTTPHNFQVVAYSDINVTCVSAIDCNQSSMRNSTPDTAVGSSTMDFSVTHVYGRVIARDVRVLGLIAFDGFARYEVFETPNLLGTALIADTKDNDWYVNTLHNEPTYGDASVTVVDPGTGSFLPNGTSSYAAGLETYKFNPFTVRQGYRAHIDTEGWLHNGATALSYLDPNGPANLDCLTHPCFNITFGRIIGNTGSAKTESEDSKANKNSTSGTGWHSTSEYAPSIR